MSNGSPPPAPRPRSRNRRRLLVAMGFGAANAALGRYALGGAGPVVPTPPPSVPDIPVINLNLLDTLDVPPVGHVFDIVIRGGRVIDPESGFDAVADVGIDGATVTAIGPDPLVGTTVIDAGGKVVAPGFIDLLSAEPNGFGEWYKVADGVTTNLCMHGVNNYANAFFRNWEDRTPLHFGGAWHQQFIRHADPEIGVEAHEPVEGARLGAFERLTATNLGNGFAGVCFSPEYAPGTTFEEMQRLATVAVSLGHMSYFHLRHSGFGRGPEGVAEAIRVAEETGSAVHLAHLSSTGGTQPEEMAEAIDLVTSARANGLDITACLYPYNFWATTLGSSRFPLDWRERFGITYEDLEIAGQGRRLTADTFAAAQAANVLVAAHGTIPEETIVMALAQPWMMIGSDGILTSSLNNHPRATGCFSRVLGVYVRERGVLDLVSALAKMTIDPARRLEAMIPALARKGRLRPGADADIVVFDPATIIDRATVAQPDQMSVGVAEVLVEGVRVLVNGELDRSVRPGRALRSVTTGSS